jgi:hypothetical protein
MLRLALKGAEDELPDQRLLLTAHAFGHMARAHADLVRAYEAEIVSATPAGRRFLLSTLQVCGDADTVKQFEAWAKDPKYAGVKNQLLGLARFLADPKRKLPRDAAVHVPTELDLLWVDFLVNGEYPPVGRILDVFDQPDLLREKIEAWRKKNPEGAAGLTRTLKQLGLTQPDKPDQLIEGDLAAALLLDGDGKARTKLVQVILMMDASLQLQQEEWMDALVLRATADWAARSNLKQHPRLRELLKQHVEERPRNSRRFVTAWLAEAGDEIPAIDETQFRRLSVALLENPLDEKSPDAARTIIVFTIQTPKAAVFLGTEELSWFGITDVKKDDPRSLLLTAAYAAGNSQSQFSSGVKRNDRYSGLLYLFEVYRRLQTRDGEFKIPAVEELLKLHKEDRLVKHLLELEEKKPTKLTPEAEEALRKLREKK